MTGEKAPSFAFAPLQPGGRRPAPGDLALVQAFLNSVTTIETASGAEPFATPRSLRTWLLNGGLIDPFDPVGRRELERAVSVRQGLRGLALPAGGPAMASDSAPAGLAGLNAAASGAAAEVRFTPVGARFVTSAGGGVAGALGLLLAIVASSMIEGSWTRLKLCPGEDCGWAFYDHSRNRTGRWCSMSVCGGRAKARAHYRRSRSPR